jgi:creatinine amidohydrolase
MRFEALNWFDVQNYLEGEDRLMLVFGSTEQHGYLSLLTDVKIPLALADAASQQSGVLVAPPINFGASPYFLAYPGTISLRITTLMDLAEDMLRSLYRHGFRRLLILNGHGGNDPIRARLYELQNELNGLQIAWYAWWQSHSVEQIALEYSLKRAHANWMEAFPFTRVADLPEGEKNPPRIPGLMGADQARKVYGDGVFGGPYAVDETIMNKIFEVALGDVLHYLRFE